VDGDEEVDEEYGEDEDYDGNNVLREMEEATLLVQDPDDSEQKVSTFCLFQTALLTFSVWFSKLM
jgi:hypothetical protein